MTTATNVVPEADILRSVGILSGECEGQTTEALSAIRKFGPKDAVHVFWLGCLVTNSHPEVRCWACDALAQIGSKATDALETLTLALRNDESPRTRYHAGRAIARMGRAARPALRAAKRAARDPAPEVRAVAACIVAKFDPASAYGVPVLVTMLDDPERFVRWVAVYTLGCAGVRNRAVHAALLRRLQTDDNMDIRAAAALALGEIQACPETTTRLLMDVLDYWPGPEAVHKAALRSLGLLGPKARSALARLRQLSQNAHYPYAGLAAEAVALIRGRRRAA